MQHNLLQKKKKMFDLLSYLTPFRCQWCVKGLNIACMVFYASFQLI